jgi:S-DNA-T family DNA segregation ATPase FtsK/SpoIIIE
LVGGPAFPGGQALAPTAIPRVAAAHRIGTRLLLIFPRRDPLASPLAAVPIPDQVSVGPVEIGKQEDGALWRLKTHGTHVPVAGAAGAGKCSIIWSTIRGLLPAILAGLATRDQARVKIATWIADFYNTRRRHSAADGLSPIDYEQQITAARAASRARAQEAMAA